MFFRAREINARFKVVCTQKPKDRSSPSHSRHFLAFCSCDTMGQSCSASNIDKYARWKQCTTPSCLNVAQMLWTALWSVAFDFVMLGNMWLGFVWKTICTILPITIFVVACKFVLTNSDGRKKERNAIAIRSPKNAIGRCFHQLSCWSMTGFHAEPLQRNCGIRKTADARHGKQNPAYASWMTGLNFQ